MADAPKKDPMMQFKEYVGVFAKERGLTDRERDSIEREALRRAGNDPKRAGSIVYQMSAAIEADERQEGPRGTKAGLSVVRDAYIDRRAMLASAALMQDRNELDGNASPESTKAYNETRAVLIQNTKSAKADYDKAKLALIDRIQPGPYSDDAKAILADFLYQEDKKAMVAAMKEPVIDNMVSGTRPERKKAQQQKEAPAQQEENPGQKMSGLSGMMQRAVAQAKDPDFQPAPDDADSVRAPSGGMRAGKTGPVI